MERALSSSARPLKNILKSHPARLSAPRSFSQPASPFPRANPSPRSSPQRPCYRSLHVSAPYAGASRPPKSRDRGPKSNEDTQTDFGALDVLRNTPPPATAIDACTHDGFALNNQVRVSGCGVLLVGGEAFRWRPWLRSDGKEGTVAEGGVRDDVMAGRLLNAKGQWEVPDKSWGILELVWPKPDLLIIGTGPSVIPIAPAVRSYLNGLGIRLEIQDTRNASAQFNLLATERGVTQVAAALIPIGWKEGR
ncbi:hypothetical protein BS50DRAFT_575253 [Corynespora cassiicola Philippines]|uniref:NADH dehydrogenase [ubiquinone] 1 alpha subcomplex assembly factor 3 n=1 Tax=Corynespora cassiicola Philippines TaxID=1448308 RepID=A0A2T2NIK4_CORCC|nr:hypothetical protein BS50DRAFT_575253 [Corynespora cassiicola Philippines]